MCLPSLKLTWWCLRKTRIMQYREHRSFECHAVWGCTHTVESKYETDYCELSHVTYSRWLSTCLEHIFFTGIWPLLHCPLPHCPPLPHGAVLSTPVMSTLATSSWFVHSYKFHPCNMVPNCQLPHCPLWQIQRSPTNSEGVRLIVRAVRFLDFQPMWSWSTNVTDRQTDGQTDGQTDNMGSQDRALLCSASAASRGKILAEFYYIPIFVIWRVGETISVVFAIAGSEMSLVWSIDEVVVLGETTDRFRSVHCAKRHYVTAVFQCYTRTTKMYKQRHLVL